MCSGIPGASNEQGSTDITNMSGRDAPFCGRRRRQLTRPVPSRRLGLGCDCGRSRSGHDPRARTLVMEETAAPRLPRRTLARSMQLIMIRRKRRGDTKPSSNCSPSNDGSWQRRHTREADPWTTRRRRCGIVEQVNMNAGARQHTKTGSSEADDHTSPIVRAVISFHRTDCRQEWCQYSSMTRRRRRITEPGQPGLTGTSRDAPNEMSLPK